MADQVVSIVAHLRDKFSPGLSSLNTKIGGLVRKISALGGRLSPVVNQFTGLATAFAGFASAREALDLARTQVQAEQKVLAALQGRTKELDRIKDITSQIQNETEFGDEALLEQAATLLRMGVAAEDLDMALRAVVNTTEGFNIPMDSVVRAIGQFQNNSAGRISMMIPQIKKLQDEGRLATDGLRTLFELTEGAAAAQAQTSFGRIQQELNALGDKGEKVGRALAEVFLEMLKALGPAVDTLSEFVQSRAFQTALEIFKEALPIIVKIGVVLSSIFAAALGLKIIGFIAPIVALLGSILGSLVSIALTIGGLLLTKIGLIVAVVGGLIFLLAKLTGAWDALKRIASDVLDFFGLQFEEFKRLFGLVSDGKLDIEDLFKFLKVRVKQAYLVVKRLIFDPAYNFISAFFRTIQAFWTMVINGILTANVKILDALQTVLLTVVRLFAKAIDNNLDLLIRGLKKVDQVFGTSLAFEGPNLEAKVPTELIELEKLGDELAKQTKEAAITFATALPKAFSETRNGIAGLAGEILKEEADLQREIEESIEKNIARIERMREESVRNAQRRNMKLRAEVAFLLDQTNATDLSSGLGTGFFNISPGEVRTLLSEAQIGVQEPLRKLLRAELDDQLRRNAIASEEYLELIREIEVGFLEKQLAQMDELIQKKRETIELQQSQIKESDGTLETEEDITEAQAKIAEMAKGILTIQEQRNEIVEELIGKEQALRSARLQTANVTTGLLDEEVDRFEAYADIIGARLSAGMLGPKEAVAAVNEATTELDAKIADTQFQLERLLAGGASPLNEDLRKLNEDLLALQTQQDDIRLATAEQVLERIQKAREELDKLIADTQDKFASGAISGDEGTALIGSGLQDFNATVEESRGALGNLSASTEEGRLQLFELRNELNTLSQETLAGLENETGSFTSSMVTGFRDSVFELGNLESAGQRVGSTLAEGLGTGLLTALTKGKEAFKEYAKEFLLRIAEMIAQALIFRAIASFIPGGQILVTGAQATQTGTKTATLNAGGWVPGPNVNADIVPALLTPGERVVDRETAGYYGENYFNAMKRRLLPRSAPSAGGVATVPKGRYNGGGPIPSSGSGSAIARTAVVSDEQEFDRMLAGGEGSMRRWFKDHRDELRSILGV